MTSLGKSEYKPFFLFSTRFLRKNQGREGERKEGRGRDREKERREGGKESGRWGKYEKKREEKKRKV